MPNRCLRASTCAGGTLYAWRTSKWKLINAPGPSCSTWRPTRRSSTTAPPPTCRASRRSGARCARRCAFRPPMPRPRWTRKRPSGCGRSATWVAAPFSPDTASSQRDPKDALPVVFHLERGMEFARSDPETAVHKLTEVLNLPRHYPWRPAHRFSKLPPVLPVVLYNGEPRWTAAEDVKDLIEEVPGGLAKYRPTVRYLLLFG